MERVKSGFGMVVFLLVTIVVVVMMTGDISQAASTQKVSWKWNFYCVNMEEEPPAKIFATQVIPKVKERTSGNFVITPLWGPELGIQPMNYPKAIVSGAIEMAWAFPGYYLGEMPIVGANALPMRVKSMEDFKVLSDVSRKYFQQGYRDAYKGQIELLAAGPYNWGEMATTKAMKSVTDWTGMKIRVPDRLSMKFVERMGGVGITMPWGEMVPGLHQGVVTGVASAFESMTKAKLYDACNHVYLIHLAVGEHHVFGSSGALAKLPEDYKKILFEELERAQNLIWGIVLPKNLAHGQAIETWRQKGATIVEMTPAQYKELSERARPIWEEWSKSVGENADKLLKEYESKIGVRQ